MRPTTTAVFGPDRNATPSAPIRVLVIEDQLEHCAIIAGRLAAPGPRPFEPVFAHCAADARALLAEQRFNCVLLDHYLPDGNGGELLQQMEHRLLATPVVALSSSRDPAVAIAGFRGGAVEFVPKREAFRGDTLRSRVLQAIDAFSRRAAAIAEAQQRLEAAAPPETASAVLDPEAIQQRQRRLHEEAASADGAYALCLAEIDGALCPGSPEPSAGDATLVRSLQSCLRGDETLGRFGGGGFAVLLPGAGQLRAAGLGERLRRSVEAIPLDREPAGRLTMSVGVAVFDAAAPEGPGAVMERAEQALRRAQAAGCNRVAIAAQSADSEQSRG